MATTFNKFNAAPTSSGGNGFPIGALLVLATLIVVAILLYLNAKQLKDDEALELSNGS